MYKRCALHLLLVAMQINRWLVAPLLLLAIVETAGFLNPGNTFAGVAAVLSLMFGIAFFGFFFLSYLGSAFQAMVNPWVNEVRRMKGPCFNPMYMAWLFENDRREWAAMTTIFDVFFSLLFGLVLFAWVSDGFFSFENSFIGFCVSCLFLGSLAISFYNGFWKPRTREKPTQIPDHLEAEWRDRRL